VFQKRLIRFRKNCDTSVALGTYGCPGFGQNRVNFHWTPGRGTGGWADPTWPNRAGYSIPCAVMLASGGGELGGGNSLAAREDSAAVRSQNHRITE